MTYKMLSVTLYEIMSTRHHAFSVAKFTKVKTENNYTIMLHYNFFYDVAYNYIRRNNMIENIVNDFIKQKSFISKEDAITDNLIGLKIYDEPIIGYADANITKKGMAGRFSSIITSYNHKPTKRNYEGLYDYCTMCGKCISNCPVKAISYEEGKNHTKCSRFIDYSEVKSIPRYGCGKCQVNLPCSDSIPIKSFL